MKLGDALKRAVETKPGETKDESGGRPSSALMHNNRRAVFKHLCLQPCSGVGEMASALSLSRATVNWHLNVLLEEDYVEGHRVHGRYVFSPKGMIPSGKAVKALSALRTGNCTDIYAAIVERPGSDAKVLGKVIQRGGLAVALARLEETHLITAVRDGRHVRFFPTAYLGEFISKHMKALAVFQRSLIQRLERERLHPHVTEIRGEGLVIKVRIQERSDEIKVPYNPMVPITSKQ